MISAVKSYMRVRVQIVRMKIREDGEGYHKTKTAIKPGVKPGRRRKRERESKHYVTMGWELKRGRKGGKVCYAGE